MNKASKIYVAGHRGMVGSAIIRSLINQGYTLDSIITRSHAQLDLTNQLAVDEFFAVEKPNQVYLAAAKVGGIHANNEYPAEFIYENIMIQANVINSAFKNGVKKLMFLGSSCIYPRLAQQPMKESALLTGTLEPTNEPYAIAKIAGIKLCESYNRQYQETHGLDYRSVMPTNLYGPGDNFHSENSHVIPSLIRRFHECKVMKASNISIWGSGFAKREFLYVDDMADACIHIMNLPKSIYEKVTQPMLSHINIGCGEDITISQLAETISKTVDFSGEIIYDNSKPDGAPRKLMSSATANALGWKARTKLELGLSATYQYFLKNHYFNDQ